MSCKVVRHARRSLDVPEASRPSPPVDEGFFVQVHDCYLLSRQFEPAKRVLVKCAVIAVRIQEASSKDIRLCLIATFFFSISLFVVSLSSIPASGKVTDEGRTQRAHHASLDISARQKKQTVHFPGRV